MTQEEKAKAYDEAIKRAKNYYCTTDSAADIKLIGLIFPELNECEDERIRKRIIHALHGDVLEMSEIKEAVAWLEKQGEHANFRNKIQVGDKVTRNEDGVLVNLSQLNRVAKKDEKQIKKNLQDNSFRRMFEQKPAWSEEDKDYYDAIIAKLEVTQEDAALTDNQMEFLKSIKDRYTWKPSDEQMNALNYVVNLMASSERPTENDLYYNILKSLRQQLKKLKGD